MKKASLLFVVILGLAAFVLAASDFSGTWVFDASKSDQMGGRGGGGGGGEMVIKQAGNELTVTRGQNETKYVADGAEHTVSAGRGEIKYKATLSGDTLTITGTRTTGRGEMPMNEKYSLSDGGKVLTVTNTSTGPNGEQTRKMVYNKQ